MIDIGIKNLHNKSESLNIKKKINFGNLKFAIKREREENAAKNLTGNINNLNSDNPLKVEKLGLRDENDNEAQKFYVMKKIDLTQRKDIRELIDKKFTDVESFLIPDENLVIGKKFIINDNFKNLANKKPYEIIGDVKDFLPKSRFNLFKKATSNSSIRKGMDNAKGMFTNLLSKLIKPVKTDENNMEILSDRKLQNIFQEKKNNKGKNMEKAEEEIYKNIDNKCHNQVKNILKKQEKALDQRNIIEKKTNNIAKYISLKTKKEEKQLLMNRTDGFRLKNEIKSKLDEQSSRNTKYGFNNDWIFSLRKTPEWSTFNNSINQEKIRNSPKTSYSNRDAINTINVKDSNQVNGQIQSNLNGNNFYQNNFNNINDCKFRLMRYHTSFDNDMWVTIKENQNFPNVNSNLNYVDQIRKPFSDPIGDLNNFTRCRSVERKFQNLNIKKEDFNKINNMKVNKFFIFIVKLLN